MSNFSPVSKCEISIGKVACIGKFGPKNGQSRVKGAGGWY